MICKNCGKELPAESSFCPYCMTKFTEEIPAINTKPAKSSNKKLIIIIVSLTVVIALAVSGILIAQNHIKNTDETKKENMTPPSSPTTDLPDEPIHTLINTDKEIGISCIKPYYTTVKLNETEKLLLDYFDTDSFTVDYNSLKDNPDIYKNSQVNFYGVVNKIISQDGGKTTALVEFGAYTGFDQVNYKSGNMAIVKLDSNQASGITGKTLNFYATFKGTENYGSSSIPSFEASRTTYYSENYAYAARFSKTEAEKVSQFFFGNKATLRQSKNEDFEFLANDFYDDISSEYFIAEINGLEGFRKYGLAVTEGGHIVDCETDENLNRYMTFSGDFRNIYVHTYDWTADTFTFDCYDKSFNKLWSRRFDESASVSMDFTSGCIYLCVKNKLYILNSKNGEDIVSPKTVGEHHGIRKLEDGILLIASDGTGVVTKTDLDGNVIWTKEVISGTYSFDIQVMDGKYIVQFLTFDSASPYYGETVTTYVFKPDGTVEFSNKES